MRYTPGRRPGTPYADISASAKCDVGLALRTDYKLNDSPQAHVRLACGLSK